VFINKDPISGVKTLKDCPVIIMIVPLVGNVMPIVAMDGKVGIQQRRIISITIPLQILRLLMIKHLRIPISILGKEEMRKTDGSFPRFVSEWSHINLWQATSNVHMYAETIKEILFSTDSSGLVIYINLIPFQLRR
jgi:hypothetical protein